MEQLSGGSLRGPGGAAPPPCYAGMSGLIHTAGRCGRVGHPAGRHRSGAGPWERHRPRKAPPTALGVPMMLKLGERAHAAFVVKKHSRADFPEQGVNACDINRKPQVALHRGRVHLGPAAAAPCPLSPSVTHRASVPQPATQAPPAPSSQLTPSSSGPTAVQTSPPQASCPNKGQACHPLKAPRRDFKGASPADLYGGQGELHSEARTPSLPILLVCPPPPTYPPS